MTSSSPGSPSEPAGIGAAGSAAAPTADISATLASTGGDDRIGHHTVTDSSRVMEPARVTVVTCGAIARHVSDVAARRGWAIDVHPLPPLLHNQPREIAGAVEREIAEVRAGDASARIAVAYADCGTYGALDAVIEGLGIARLHGEHCYDVFAGADTVAALLDEQPGTYFLTDYLVRSFRRSVVVELGLDRHPELREDYFRHYTRVVWLAQAPDDDLTAAAHDAATVMGLPLEVRPVGDVGLEAQLDVLLRSLR